MSLLKNTFTQTVTLAASTTINTFTPVAPVPGASRLLGVYVQSVDPATGAAKQQSGSAITDFIRIFKKDGSTQVGTQIALAAAGTAASLIPSAGTALAKTAIDTSYINVQGATVAVQTTADNSGTESLKVGRDGWYDNTVGGKDLGTNYIGATFPADAVLLDVAAGDWVIVKNTTATAAATTTSVTLLWEKI
ncbi:MAG: hypothetical protein EBY26_00260 [Microbacteriaceae bacterium]|nr:hypothetical protein [Microbacteriaceae bacterium]